MKKSILFLILFLSCVQLPASEEGDVAASNSAYISAMKSGNVDSICAFIAGHRNKLISVLAACRLIHLELGKNIFLDRIVSRLNENGLLVISKNEFSNASAVYFPEFKLRTIIYDNYYYHDFDNPNVELLNSSEKKYVFVDFGALHVWACSKYFEVVTSNIHYYLADSVALKLAMNTNLNALLNNFSKKMDYNTPEKAMKKLLGRESYQGNKLVLFIYDVDKIKEDYLLHGSGRSHAYNGIIYIDSGESNRKTFISTFMHELSHIFYNGTRFQTLHKDSRWFDEGFAQWVAFCYTELNTLMPEKNTFLYKRLDDFIAMNRYSARVAFFFYKTDCIRLKEINEQWSSEKGMYGTQYSYQLALSLVCFLAEKFGADKLVEIAKTISHTTPDLTEHYIRNITKWDYNDIERRWSKWIMSLDEKEKFEVKIRVE